MESGYTSSPSTKCIAAWASVKMMVIDEISMLSCGSLAVIDHILRTIFNNDLPYGGIHMLFDGDLRQLQTNGHLWLKPNPKKEHNYMSVAGAQIWRDSTNTAFFLTSAKRFDDDLDWGSDMHDLNQRSWTREHLERMDVCHVDKNDRTIPAGIKIITPCNDLRESVGREIQAQYGIDQLKKSSDPTLTWRQRGAIVITMTVHRRKAKSHVPLEPATPSQLKYVRKRCPEKFLDDMPGELCYILGETYAFTKGLAINRGMAKSMWVEAVDLKLIDENDVTWDPATGLHYVEVTNVDMAVVRLLLGNWPKKTIFDIPVLNKKQHRGLVPVKPSDQTSVTVPMNGFKMLFSIM